ncbi:probable palmitoyltransferase ZDHHC12 [Acanthaster planci]|uniref:Palmitoyltransferase n=1 Tax=Acanthaster planci TaxID=133434 RepID=A0A8B8A1C1_ACAPL|nr:probable palmitoyltransferase ZDHHC12 [Acanthaster planci]XP_022111470.1 probable palmitoyltransferase ZDHHC12 [Acanthaster planci]
MNVFVRGRRHLTIMSKKLFWKVTSGMFIRTFHVSLTLAILCVFIFKDTALREAILQRDIPYVLAFATLLTISGGLYFQASLMDPGFVPVDGTKNRAWENDSSSDSNEEKDDEEDEDGRSSSKDEEAVRMLSSPRRRAGVRLRKCDFCEIKQPMRSKHCEDCSRCVRKFDHHCPWLENCVGESNHRFFWLFLLTETTLVLWSLQITWGAFQWKHTLTEWLKANAFFLVCIIIIALAAMALTGLLCCHSYMMITNQTTWEFMSHERITYLRNLEESVNPFDEGYLRNCVKFFFYCPYRRWEQMVEKKCECVHPSNSV